MSRARLLLGFWRPALVVLSILAVTITILHTESVSSHGGQDQVHILVQRLIHQFFVTLEAADWLRDPAGGGALDHRGAPAGGLLPGPGCGAAPPRCHGHGLSSQVRISRAQDIEIFQP